VTNSHEGTIFTDPATLIANNFTLSDYIAGMLPQLGGDQLQRAVSLYSDTGLTNITDLAAEVMGDSMHNPHQNK